MRKDHKQPCRDREWIVVPVDDSGGAPTQRFGF
jgi:hypothetical protein